MADCLKLSSSIINFGLFNGNEKSFSSDLRRGVDVEEETYQKQKRADTSDINNVREIISVSQRCSNLLEGHKRKVTFLISKFS